MRTTSKRELRGPRIGIRAIWLPMYQKVSNGHQAARFDHLASILEQAPWSHLEAVTGTTGRRDRNLTYATAEKIEIA